ncbi:hypothetical protein AB0M87_20535 [Streptomyces sp. NPDC051320]|uniref:hypothetical protein n=1 Tax=Streptomyces sp. NPDC051320 TaxID=3154644 RepID=UPI00344A128A
MNLMRRLYGTHPAHLLVMLCCFAVATYAAVRLLAGRTLAVAIWFIGAALLHDLVLLPLYSGADRTAQAALAPRAGRASASGWINYLRTPLALSLMLLLVWFPLILRRSVPYQGASKLSDGVYLGRWLLITAGLFAASAVAAIVNARRRRRRTHRLNQATARPGPGPRK